jgi:hypothetical protein
MLVARRAHLHISVENSANSAVSVTLITANTALSYTFSRWYGKCKY